MANKLNRFIKRLVYGGNKYYCPLCETGLRKLNDIDIHRPNAECPVCLSRERGRMLWLFFERQTDLFKKPAKFLHVAPELQLFIRFSQFKNLDYTGIDKFEEGYTNYHTGTIYGDITDLKDFKDNTFDYLLCSHVLEHVPADAKAISELKRVIKPGGHAYIMVPQDFRLEHTLEDPSIVTPEQKMAAYGQYDHVREYGRDFINRLLNAGFKVNTIDYVKQLSAAEVDRFRLTSEFIYDCTK